MMSGIALWCPLFDAVTDRSLDMSAVEMVSSFLGAGVFKTLRAAFDDSISELCASAMDDEESSVVDRDVVKHTALCSVLMITSCIRHIMSSKSLRGSSTGEELINGVVSSFCPDSSMFAFLEKTIREVCSSVDCMSLVAALGSMMGLGDKGHVLGFIMPLMHLAKCAIGEEDRQQFSDLCDCLMRVDYDSACAIRIKFPRGTIDELARLQVRYAEDPLGTIGCHVEWMQQLYDICESSESGSVPVSLTIKTMPQFYRCAFEELVARFKKASFDTGLGKCQESLDVCSAYVGGFSELVLLTKVCTSKPVHALSVRQSKHFIGTFLTSAMPLLDASFVLHRGVVTGMLKQLQSATRQLQHLCAHAKQTRNQSMMGSVPGLKRALEATIFRFKALAEKHEFMDAFRIGVLKNRNVDGSVYVERHEKEDDEDDEEDEEEEEEEDEDASE